MNILLTGATGFVGNALYRELRLRKHRLTCTFRSRMDKMAHQVEYRTCRRIDGIHIDGETCWTKYLRDIDQIVHLAGQAHVLDKPGQKQYRRFFSVNHEGTRNLAAQAARQGVKRFVFMSSILVNGSESPAGPFCETDMPCPRNVYATAKYEAEKSLEKIGAETGMEVVILRPPLVYGPGVKANFFKLLDLVYAGVPMPLGAVDNQRSFIGLQNLVDAVCLCLDHKKAGNQIFVISDGKDLSTPGLITTIAGAMGRPARLFAVPDRIMKTGLTLLGKKQIFDRLWGTLQVDPTRICTRLGWRPPVPVDQEIGETVNWYLENRQHPSRLTV